ncbi:putative gustatory receptor 47b [Drosophila virilis]|uniref:Gustatory receptor n=1 Tax=Drosophila virilis TaxID=7244 RepID=B4LQ57_DROVI|nr:putative gustatory receptor 47b [Drosophila virilis]EDW61342.1 uncharacterized protein Dvir_GJ20353 [Drosophila virilis]
MKRQTTHGSDGFVYCYNSLYRLLFYWGVITFRLHNQRDGGPRSTALSVLYALSVRFGLVFGFGAGIYIKLSDEQMSQAMFSHLTPVVKIIFAWECLACIVTYVELCVSLDTHRRRHIRMLASMQLLDTQISAQFPHVRWRYHLTRSKYWYGTVVVTCCYVTISLAIMLDTTHCSCGYVSTILIASTYSLLTSTLGLMGFIHVGLMDYLRIRFRLIIKLVEQLYKAADKDEQDELLLRMGQLIDFAKRCSQLLTEMNGVCGYVAAAGIFYDFAHMTCFVYVLCQKLLRIEPWDTQYAFISLHLGIHMYKVLITSIYGYLLQREKRNCMRLLSNYPEHFGNRATHKDQLECFLYWRMHNNQIATIGTSFPCNISLIYLVLNAMANYVIVLVQLLFQLQDKKQGHAISVPKDVELLKPIDQITHLSELF